MKPDIKKIRQDFPILGISVNNNPLIYFDNAATTQNPEQVLKAIQDYYHTENSNVHRGNYFLSQKATESYENARLRMQKFIHAGSKNEIIFTRGTTESINLVASSFGKQFIKPGDEIIISTLEHHSNIVPWQFVCEDRGAKLKIIPVSESGELMLDEFEKLISPKTKLVSVAHISNALGTINPIKNIISIAKKYNITTCIDGAQGVSHLKVNVQELDCDFYVFSGHKIYGPAGIGVLYGKSAMLEKLPPYQGGGEMIDKVTFEKTTYNELPYKFEAGTPNISGAIGLAAAIDYVESIGLENIMEYEHELLVYATKKLNQLEGMRIIGNAAEKASVISFLVEGTHPVDLGMILDKMGIAVRVGNHCAQPLMRRFEIPGTVRASFAFYNTFEEIDTFIEKLKRAVSMLKQ